MAACSASNAPSPSAPTAAVSAVSQWPAGNCQSGLWTKPAVGAPWLSAASRRVLLRYATTAPAASAEERRARQQVLRALILAGPDAQVM